MVNFGIEDTIGYEDYRMFEYKTWEQLAECLWQEKYDCMEHLIDMLEENDQFMNAYRKGRIDAYDELLNDIRHKLKHGALESIESANEGESLI